MNQQTQQKLLSLPVIVAALGYFVDMYDLALFTIVRVPSLQAMGLDDLGIKNEGIFIFDMQMAGLLLGGILWGILGDKKGRLRVLFGSILLYSLANIANGFVVTVEQYAWVRFIAGIGLAGELGVGITLVSEVLSKHNRGIGTSIVASVGFLGVVLAYFVAQVVDWRTCYFVGGGLGLLLLVLRVRVIESGMFENIKQQAVSRGNFLAFFNNWERFKKYALSILIGLPTWCVGGVLVVFSKEFGAAMQLAEVVNPAKSVMFSYVGVAVGDMVIGLVSQYFKSRKKALFIFYGLVVLFTILYFSQPVGGSTNTMYLICFLLGISTGFWAIFVTMGAEQFGTNLRATAATTIPNMVRGSLPLILFLFKDILQMKMGVAFLTSGMITSTVVLIISFWAAWNIPETFHKNLDYIEEIK
jgi:MFS family permease